MPFITNCLALPEPKLGKITGTYVSSTILALLEDIQEISLLARGNTQGNAFRLLTKSHPLLAKIQEMRGQKEWGKITRGIWHLSNPDSDLYEKYT
jgi:hypothetical protein